MAVSTDTMSGPWGNDGGNFWSFRPINKIDQIVIIYSGGNNPIAMTLSSTRADGSKDTMTVGGGGPDQVTNTDTVNIGPDEYLTVINGRIGIYLDNNVIRQISFTTNKKVHGPFGPNVGTPFSSVNVVGNQITGLCGRAGYYIDAIGTYSGPAPQ